MTAITRIKQIALSTGLVLAMLAAMFSFSAPKAEASWQTYYWCYRGVSSTNTPYMACRPITYWNANHW